MGDVILSGDEEVGVSPNIPTVGDTRSVFPEGSGFVITGLRQKIAVLGRNLVVGWAGGCSIAHTIIKDLRDRNSKTSPLTNDRLRSFFNDWEGEVKGQPVAFCGYLIDPNSLVAFNSAFNTEEVKFETELFGNICLLGSELATDNLRERLQSIQKLLEMRNEQGMMPSPVEVAVIFALQTSGVLLEYEMRSHQSLLNYFGGGYEVSSLGQRGFSKLNGVT